MAHLGFPVISSALTLQSFLFGDLDHLLLHHEALQSIQSLLKRLKLASRQSFVHETPLEFAVIERRPVKLLFIAQFSQNALCNMQIQGHAALDGAHSHQIHHSLRVEVGLVDPELFHRDIRQFRVNALEE